MFRRRTCGRDCGERSVSLSSEGLEASFDLDGARVLGKLARPAPREQVPRGVVQDVYLIERFGAPQSIGKETV